MATKKQKEELIQALKFTPRNIEISLTGYGGEIALGTISEAAYDYWKDRDDLGDFVTDWDDEFEDVPAEARFVTDGSWYDIDDICHESGCEASDLCNLTVEDLAEGKTIFESGLDLETLDRHGIDTSNHSHSCPYEDEDPGTYVFMGQSIEKGVFFSGQIRITQPFDPEKLSIHWHDCDGWRIITSVEYDGEEIDGSGAYSTTGKSMDFKIYEVEREDDIPVMEGEEMWASEQIDAADEVEQWEGHELSPWWDASDLPTRSGRYQVLIGTWPFPQWANYTKHTGWQPDHDGDPAKIVQWRGLAKPAL